MSDASAGTRVVVMHGTEGVTLPVDVESPLGEEI